MINLFLEKNRFLSSYGEHRYLFKQIYIIFFTKYDFSSYFAYKNIKVKLSQVNRLKDFFLHFLDILI